MLRAFALIRRDPLAFLHRTWLRHGDMVQFPIPQPATYLVTGPDAVNRVLQANHTNYGKATLQYQRLSMVTGNGLLVADTGAWREQRRVLQPAFGRALLSRVEAASLEACKRLEAQWSRAPSSIVDVDLAMQGLALEVVGESLFGVDLTGSAAGLAQATLEGLEVVVRRSRSPLAAPGWLPTHTNRMLTRANARLDAAVADIVARPAPAGTLLEVLQNSDMSAREIRDQVVTFLVAGHETVASALTWSLYLVAAHPEHREATSDDVFAEALRLFPPAWLITRRSLGADTLDGVEIPAGALLIISPYVLHRHPGVWERPGAFVPGRTMPRVGYIPFGAGPRLCIGRAMSLLEGRIVLDRLRERFTFAAGPRPAIRPEVTLRPVGGMPLQVTRRP